jgi:hypothetical protein
VRWQYIVLPAIEGFGYALIEVEVHTWLGYFTQSILHFLLQSLYTELALNPDWRQILYFTGMFIVLGTPWTIWRSFWAWLMSTAIAFWAEDASYWLLALELPHSWGVQTPFGYILVYPTWNHIPLDYFGALAMVLFDYYMLTREVVIKL